MTKQRMLYKTLIYDWTFRTHQHTSSIKQTRDVVEGLHNCRVFKKKTNVHYYVHTTVFTYTHSLTHSRK